MTKKITLKNVIAMLMAVLMVTTTMIAAFGSFIVINASTKIEETKTTEVSTTNVQTKGTGVVNNMTWHVINASGSNNPWYADSIRFYYKSGNTPQFANGSNTPAYPEWGLTQGGVTLFNTSSESGWNVMGGSSNVSRWMHMTSQIENNGEIETVHYRALCMDPIFRGWLNGTTISTGGTNAKLSNVIRIDRDVVGNNNIPEEYKVLRRLMWYTYFGGGGLLSTHATTMGNHDDAFYNYYNNTTNNKILAKLIASGHVTGTNSAYVKASMHAQYIFLHVAAAYVSDLSVAKARSNNASYNYSSTYPALGYTGSRTYPWDTTITLQPTLNNFNNTTWRPSSIINAGWNLIRANKGDSYRFKPINTEAQNIIVEYIQSLRSDALDANIPDGFVCYVCIPNSSGTTGDHPNWQYQSYVVYSIENGFQLKVQKSYTPTNISGVNLAGARYGVYKTYSNAQTETNVLHTFTIGSNNQSDVWGETLEAVYLDVNRNDNDGVCKIYNYFIKELNGPTNTPSGYTWIVDPTIHRISIQGIGCGENGFINQNAITQEFLHIVNSTNTLQRSEGYFKLQKTVTPTAYKPQGVQFTIYNDPDCQNIATDITQGNGTGNSSYTVNAGVITIKSSATGSYTTGAIKVPFIGTNSSRTLYIKETRGPSNPTTGTWLLDPEVHEITITGSHTSTNPYFEESTCKFVNSYASGKGYMQIRKKAVNSLYDNFVGGTQFKLYSDVNCTQLITSGIEIKNGSTWSNLTTGIITIPTNNNGLSPLIRVDLGGEASRTIFIKETRNPTQTGGPSSGWSPDNIGRSWSITIRANSNHIETNPATMTVRNADNDAVYYTGYVFVKKAMTIDNGSIITNPSSAINRVTGTPYDLTGAQYAAYFSRADAQSDTNRIGLMTIGTYQPRILVNVDGSPVVYNPGDEEYTWSNVISWSVDSSQLSATPPTRGPSDPGNNLYGKIYIKEIKGPDQPGNWQLDTTIYETVVKYHSPTSMWSNDDWLYNGIEHALNGNNQTYSVNNFITPKYAYFRLQKRASIPSTSPEGPASIDYSGAEYTVYNDSACTNIATDIGNMGVLVSDAQGYIPSPNGYHAAYLGYNRNRTIYVKETKVPNNAPNGWYWEIDTNVYTITLTPEHSPRVPYTLRVNEPLKPATGYFRLNKILPSPFTNPTGAQYSVYNTRAAAQTALNNILNGNPAGTNGLATDISKYDGNGSVSNGIITFVNSTTGPRVTVPIDVTVSSTGGKRSEAAGTNATRELYIIETRLPNTTNSGDNRLDYDRNIYRIVVSADNTVYQPVTINSYEPKHITTYGWVQVHKVITGGPTGITGQGIVYGVYDTEAHAQAGGYNRGNATGTGVLGTLTITSTNYSNALRLSLGEDAEYRTVYIKEVYAPNPPAGYSWALDTSIHAVDVYAEPETSQSTPVIEDSTNILSSMNGIMKINKAVTDNDSSTNNDAVTYSPVGAQYAVYNTRAAAQTALTQLQNNGTINTTGLATDIGNRGIITIVQTGKNGSYGSGDITVPINSGSSRKLWVIEVKAPNYNENGTADPSWHWELDTTIHAITVTPGDAATVNSTMSSTNTVVPNDKNNVYLRVKKTVTGAQNGDVISPAGAIYGVYNTLANAQAGGYNPSTNQPTGNGILGIVTIGSNGVSNTLTININYDTSRTVYVKELTTPPAVTGYTWNIDTTIYTCNLTVGSHGTISSPYNVNSTNSVTPLDHNVAYIKVTKSVTGGNISPEGATYGIFSDLRAALDASGNTSVGGYCLAIVTIGSNGVSNVTEIDLVYNTSKTVYVKELTAPAVPAGSNYSWNLDTTVHEVTLNANSHGSVSSALNVNSTNSINWLFGYVYVHKLVPRDFNPYGAQYTAYSSRADAEADRNRIGVMTIDSTGYSNRLRIDFDTNANSKVVYIKETRLPNQTGNFEWELDTTIYDVTVSYTNSPASNAVMVESTNNIHYTSGYVYVHKTVPTGYQPTGAVYRVYTNAACTQVLSGVPDLVIDSRGNSNVVEIPFLANETSRTIWIKEVQKPSQTEDGFIWTIDEIAHEVTITQENNSVESAHQVNSSDEVIRIGYVQVHKSVPDNSNPAGATYRIYIDPECENPAKYEDLVISSDGYSNLVEILLTSNPMILYVKEISAPTNPPYGDSSYTWVMDQTAHEIRVTDRATAQNPVMVESVNTASRDEVAYLQVYKSVPRGYNPTGAEYTIYTDANCETPMSGVSVLQIDSTGYSQIVTVPLGTNVTNLTVYVKETKLPSQTGTFYWNWDTNIYEAQLTNTSSVSNPVLVSSSDTVTLAYAAFRIQKVVPRDYSGAGAVFTVYTDANCREIATDLYDYDANVAITDGEVVIQRDGYSHIIYVPVQADGTIRTLYIKETKVPTQTGNFIWNIDTSVHAIELSATGRPDVTPTPVLLTVNNTVILPNTGSFQIRKLVPRGYSAEGAEYTVYNSADDRDIATDIGNDGVVVIGSNGYSAIISVDLGFDDYRDIYIRETKVPDQTGYFDWTIDTEWHHLRITKDNLTGHVVVSEDGVNLYQSLTIEKTVTGNMGNKTKKFHFTITIDNLTGSFEAIDKNGDPVDDVVFTDGVAHVELSHGEAITILHLPYGVTYTVTEDSYVNYTTTYTDNYTGTLIQSQVVKFTNDYSVAPPTGVMSTAIIGTTVLLPSALGLVLINKKKKKS
jgi:fibronectin-binding protein 1